MKNKDILKLLQAKRSVTGFALYLNMTPQGLYKLLKSEKVKDNQYYNFIRFVLSEYTKEKKPRKSV